VVLLFVGRPGGPGDGADLVNEFQGVPALEDQLLEELIVGRYGRE